MINIPKPKGTYADYISRNKIEDKIFVFELSKNNKDNPQMVSETGRPIPFPLSVKIPMIGTIYHTDDTGKTYPRPIRYAEGERSIYVDEQTPDDKKPKKMVYADFVNGRIVVDGRQLTRLEFFMKWDINATKTDRDTSKTEMFYLVDTSKQITKAREADKAKFKVAQWCFDAPLDKVRAVASLKLNSEQMVQNSEDIRWNLKLIAERDPEGFLAMLNNPSTERRYIMLKAIEKGIVTVNTKLNAVCYSDNPNAPLTVAPAGKDPVEDFITKSFSASGERYFNDIREVIEPTVVAEERVTPEVAKPNVQKQEVVEPVIRASAESDIELNILAEAAIEKGLVVFKPPMWFNYKGENFRKKEGLIQALRDNPTMLEVMKNEVNK